MVGELLTKPYSCRKKTLLCLSSRAYCVGKCALMPVRHRTISVLPNYHTPRDSKVSSSHTPLSRWLTITARVAVRGGCPGPTCIVSGPRQKPKRQVTCWPGPGIGSARRVGRRGRWPGFEVSRKPLPVENIKDDIHKNDFASEWHGR
jgi:hypothetical protein